MAASCFHHWRAPIYFTASLLLAFIAISTGLLPARTVPLENSEPGIPLPLLLKASTSLRRAGFAGLAALLPVYPEYFFSLPNTTIFAIPDSSILDFSVSPLLLRDLVRYQTMPMKLSMGDLLEKPKQSCLPTSLQPRNIIITNSDKELMLVEINNIALTYPDIFLADNLAIHGVLAPFVSAKEEDGELALNFPESLECESKAHELASVAHESDDNVDWGTVIHSLSSNGFISFAIALNSVLDGILNDDADINSVTIFAPLEFPFLSSEWDVLERIVRAHILPQKYSPKELAALPGGTLLKTLVPNRLLKIHGKENSTEGVDAELQCIFESANIVIYNKSRPLEMTETKQFSS
ncbi:hypothetical protein MLD38_003068 [Melastoma candidum]|uniref:Uncharacterized protein n=1 Tax=Melastoma candidum TaxID=119954 RepID=A0ACB9S0M6_9MYRT|nr:hypothetical protein MLD38_003068 [Melastoma candidum]